LGVAGSGFIRFLSSLVGRLSGIVPICFSPETTASET
jgi:hypothetical protein